MKNQIKKCTFCDSENVVVTFSIWSFNRTVEQNLCKNCYNPEGHKRPRMTERDKILKYALDGVNTHYMKN